MKPEITPELPFFNKNSYFNVDKKEVSKILEYSNRNLVFCEDEENNFNIFFSGLDHIFYSSIVASLSNPNLKNNNIYEFLKLSIEAVRGIKSNLKKGFNTSIKIENYLKNK